VTTTPKRFKVALSFAGEQRGFVEEVANILAARFDRTAVLYDKFHEAEFSRPRLAHLLMDLYQDESELIVVIACPDYQNKPWTGLEWDTIHDKFVRDRRHDEVMLCRFGLVQMPGSLSTDGWCQLDDKSPADLVELIRGRLARNDTKLPTATTGIASHAPTLFSSSQRPPFTLPQQAAHFVGRRREQAELKARLVSRKTTAVVGAAGMGKTALVARVLTGMFGRHGEQLAQHPFSDGVFFLNLYRTKGSVDAVLSQLADEIMGAGFEAQQAAAARAREACATRRMLVIVEGGEEADGRSSRGSRNDFEAALSPSTCLLWLTRDSKQAIPTETVFVQDRLDDGDACELLDVLTRPRHERIDEPTHRAVLELLQGHPLALTWAGHLLARDEEDPRALARDWRQAGLPVLSDPEHSTRTLGWLFGRSHSLLEESAKRALAASGRLAAEPFPTAVIAAALGPIAETSLKRLVQHGLLARRESLWNFTHVLGYRFARGLPDGERDVGAVASWLRGTLEAALSAPPIDVAADPILRHTQALLEADQEHRLGDLLVSPVLLLLDHAIEHLPLHASFELATSLLNWTANSTVAERDLLHWMALNLQSRLSEYLGDLPSATELSETALTLARSYNASTEVLWHEKLAISLLRRSAIPNSKSLMQLDEAIQILRQTLSQTEVSRRWDLSSWLATCLSEKGMLLFRANQLDDAHASLTEAIAVRSDLVRFSGGALHPTRNLNVSIARRGHVFLESYRRTGEQRYLVLAAHEYEDCAVRAQLLVDSNPGNSLCEKDRYLALASLGEAKIEFGDLKGAEALFRRSLAKRQQLAMTEPERLPWQHDMALGHFFLARCLGLGSHVTGSQAREEAVTALNILDRLVSTGYSHSRGDRDRARALVDHLHSGRSAAE
jgi:tetratricopeptide (TPR) repeat protein